MDRPSANCIILTSDTGYGEITLWSSETLARTPPEDVHGPSASLLGRWSGEVDFSEFLNEYYQDNNIPAADYIHFEELTVLIVIEFDESWYCVYIDEAGKEALFQKLEESARDAIDRAVEDIISGSYTSEYDLLELVSYRDAGHTEEEIRQKYDLQIAGLTEDLYWVCDLFQDYRSFPTPIGDTHITVASCTCTLMEMPTWITRSR